MFWKKIILVDSSGDLRLYVPIFNALPSATGGSATDIPFAGSEERTKAREEEKPSLLKKIKNALFG